jgi:hypothetical protein
MKVHTLLCIRTLRISKRKPGSWWNVLTINKICNANCCLERKKEKKKKCGHIRTPFQKA